MPAVDEGCCSGRSSADDVDIDGPGRQRCSCLPFGFWGGGFRSRGADAAPGKTRRRRRQWRLRFRLRLSWFAWPWLRKGKKGVGGDGGTKGKKKRSGGRLLLLLTTSLQARKALESVVSGDGALLPAKVSGFGDAKSKRNRSWPRLAAADGTGTAPSGTGQPQEASAAAATASARGGTGTALARPGTSQQPATATATQSQQPATATAGRVWRAPSTRRHSFRQPGRGEWPAAGGGGLWTAATTLGVMVLFGRVTAVVFLCSCLYGASFVRARLGGAGAGSAKQANGSGVAAGSSRRFGDTMGVAAENEKAVELCASTTEDCRKKVVMAGLLDRAGNRPSSRFGR